MNFINKCLKKFKKNRKGASTIEMAIGALILVLLIAFLTDLLMIGWKFSVASQTSTFVARTVGIQGGVLGSPPQGYPSNDYMNSSKLNASVKNKLNTGGIEDSEFSLKVDGRDITNGATTGKIDYLKDIETELEVKYEWMTGKVLPPLLGEKTFTSRRISTSEWKYDYNEWDGE